MTAPAEPRRLVRDDILTAAQVAQLLSLPKSTVYALAKRGELPCARLGRTVRFVRDDIETRLRGSPNPLSARPGERLVGTP
jgi:excisionase family DNA binding protein